MCVKPNVLPDGTPVSCRECDECVQTAINDWTSRAEIENDFFNHAVALTLTYNNENSDNRRGAKVFVYKHVQDFMKRLRERYYKAYGKKAGLIRYAVAGECGSLNGRVHWHMILFSQYPITDRAVGEWSSFGKPQPYQPETECLDWDVWPHGFTYGDETNRDNIRYVMKYSQKSKFSHRSSMDTKRAIKSENYAASFFRMSKRPPLGYGVFEQILNDCRETESFPLSLDIRLPSGGYFYPRGKMRRVWVLALREYLEEYEQEHGRKPPQFPQFVKSMTEIYDDGGMSKDWELFFYGEVEPDNYDTQFIGPDESKVSSKALIYAILNRCGKAHPCATCRATVFDYDKTLGAQTAQRGECNPYCQKRNDTGHIKAFDGYRRAKAVARQTGYATK